MKNILYALAIALPFSAYALDASDFADLEGYTVVKVTKVDGDFEGCDYGTTIKLTNGWNLTCNTYHYHYSYSPTVAVFSMSTGGRHAVKAVIDDYIYDMAPVN